MISQQDVPRCYISVDTLTDRKVERQRETGDVEADRWTEKDRQVQKEWPLELSLYYLLQ